MIPTPFYSHISDEDFLSIYEPSEDTFLLIDTLEKEQHILKSQKPLICLEVGSGSGVVITFLAKITENKSFYIATDINLNACICSKKTGHENNVYVETHCDSFASSMMQRLQGNIDILLFNPPYVLTPSEEIGKKDISAAWAGGKDGREVIDKFLPQAINLLSPAGFFYIVLIKENKPYEIISFMHDNGFHGEVVAERKSGPENLLVIKFSRS
ncbi:methyltransferase N6AMT1 [Hydra vulgaris]|uniref:Methyltransferase HEMK2 n=1 Tax=Hydra vulgaris TaxID=6087 RepID=T2M241_HYDVU|nr:methyltransferase N6AMT1 [Hydra vulgaris]